MDLDRRRRESIRAFFTVSADEASTVVYEFAELMVTGEPEDAPANWQTVTRFNVDLTCGWIDVHAWGLFNKSDLDCMHIDVAFGMIILDGYA